MARISRRWRWGLTGGVLAIVAVFVVIRLQVSIPTGSASTPLVRTVLTGSVEPDPTVRPGATDELDPEPLGPFPAGQECLSRIARGTGWLDLCWAGYRFGAEVDRTKDYYVLRVYGSHEGLRWIQVRAQLVGSPGDNVYDIWPDGTYEGDCRQEPVRLMVPLADLPPDDICGRTESHKDFERWSHELVWTCEGCLFPDSVTRGLAMYGVVGMPAGTVPSWDLFADAGG